MGFAVSRTHPAIHDIGERILAQVHWDDGFAAWAAAYRTVPLVSSYVDYATSLVCGWLDELADGGALLVVAHGGVVEALAVGLSPETDWTPFGSGAGYVEGFTARIHQGDEPLLRAVKS